MSNSMTNEEAIRILDPDCKEIWKAYDDKDMERCNKACRVAVKALKKQIPKKTTHPYKYCLNHQCSTCGDWEWSTYISGKWKPNYCPNCGQALDWSDEE